MKAFISKIDALGFDAQLEQKILDGIYAVWFYKHHPYKQHIVKPQENKLGKNKPHIFFSISKLR